jgi:3-hydroxybutyryl-CoA dehydrogenase
MSRIGVVGAGLMGAEIALVFALGGAEVILVDRSEEALASALQRLQAALIKGVMRGFYQPEVSAVAMSRIRTSIEMTSFADCAMVTEAVFEDLEVKRAVLRSLDEICNPACILATNTSTIPISTLAAAVSPARRPLFIGTHYFSPVSRMKLVEVIASFDTSQATLERTLEFCAAASKTAIRVKDVAGFAVNRVLHAFLIEAVRLVEEGVASVEDIDTACRLGLGHPMGPFELMDATTSSLCVQAQEIMFEAYGERFRPRPLLKQRVRAGLVGGKNAKGWRKS